MIISKNVEETIAAGRDIGATAGAGDIFALRGDLGAGKTHWVKGFVSAIGAPADVTSPTFTLVHEYESGRLPVYHFDFYRLETVDAARRLGLDEYFFGNGVCVVEWADRFPELIPETGRWIRIGLDKNGARMIEECVVR